MTSTDLRAALEAHAKACRDAMDALRTRPELPQELRANLAGANLADAYLADAYLADANLARANLAGAYLAGANLADANLADAYLAGANLAGANLARADLADANLADADLARAKGIKDALTIGPIGSRRATLTAVHREDGTIELSTGCFRGTVDEFVAAVDKTHAQNEHGRAYRAAIELIRIRFAQVAQAVTA